jgi:hypothetical protein
VIRGEREGMAERLYIILDERSPAMYLYNLLYREIISCAGRSQVSR